MTHGVFVIVHQQVDQPRLILHAKHLKKLRATQVATNQ